MNSLEFLIRKRLGQKKFEPINEQKHRRFDFAENCIKNKKIIDCFNDFQFYKSDKMIHPEDKKVIEMKYVGNFHEMYKLNFYKGTCRLLYKGPFDEDNDKLDELFNYDHYGTIQILHDLIINRTTNYKEIIRAEKLKMLGL